jgi:hypothetical protein
MTSPLAKNWPGNATRDVAGAELEVGRSWKAVGFRMSDKGEIVVSEAIRVMVDYRLNPVAMVETGKYDMVSSEVFDVVRTLYMMMNRDKSEVVRVVLVHIGHEISTDKVLNMMDREGLRPAILPELLALGATCPWLQLDFRIVALGTQSWREDGKVDVPILFEIEDGRHLSLIQAGPTNDSWMENDRFLAVRKRMSSNPLIP